MTIDLQSTSFSRLDISPFLVEQHGHNCTSASMPPAQYNSRCQPQFHAFFRKPYTKIAKITPPALICLAVPSRANSPFYERFWLTVFDVGGASGKASSDLFQAARQPDFARSPAARTSQKRPPLPKTDFYHAESLRAPYFNAPLPSSGQGLFS